jgi:hypothetical protein
MSHAQGGFREKRRAPRAPRQWPVEIRNGAGRLWRGTGVDISTVGMRVRLEEPLELRGFMFISFDPGDSIGPIWTRFSLVREIVPSTEYAIRFLDLPPQNIERLARLLAT